MIDSLQGSFQNKIARIAADEEHYNSLKQADFDVLDQYLRGSLARPKSKINKGPRFKKWESTLTNALNSLVFYELNLLQLELFRSRRWNTVQASNCFSISFIASQALQYSLERYPIRFNGRKNLGFHPGDLCFIAFGLIIGAREEAMKFFQTFQLSKAEGWYNSISERDVHHRLERLILLSVEADQSDLANVSEIPKFAQDMMSNDVDKIRASLKNACDNHLHECAREYAVDAPVDQNNPKKGAEDFGAFSNGFWMNIPLEYLLIKTVRTRAGMDTPSIEHFLVREVFDSQLPQTGFHLEPPYDKVLKKMKSQGFRF